MAEAFGVVASSLEIIGTVLKLRRLWKEVKEAPARVFDLLEEVEFIGRLLSNAQDIPSLVELPASLDHVSYLSKSTAMCQMAAKSLRDVVQALDEKLNAPQSLRRKLAVVKAYLKKDDIQRLTTKLDRAVQLLVLANQHVQSVQNAYILANITFAGRQARVTEMETYTHAAIPREPVMPKLLEDVSGTTDSFDSERTPNRDSTISKQSSFQYRPASNGFACRVSFPTWYTKMVWDIQVIKAISGWKLTVRSYNYRPWGSPVFEYVVEGNLEKLQELFNHGKASPFDRDCADGMTLQHFALAYGRLKISRFLTDRGLDVAEVDFSGESALLFANLCRISSAERNEMYDKQLSYSQDINDDNIRRALWLLCGYAGNGALNQFKMLRDKWFPFYESVPIILRLAMSRSICFWDYTDSANIFRYAIADDGYITEQVLELSVEKRMSLLHAAAYTYGSERGWPHITEEEDGDDGWQQLLQHLIHTKPNSLHSLDTWQSMRRATLDVRAWGETASGSDVGYMSWTATPFMALIKGVVLAAYSPDDTTFQTLVLHAVQAWLRILLDCGIDLDTYGRQEREVFLLDSLDVKEHVACCSRLELLNLHTDDLDPDWDLDCDFWTEGPASHRSYHQSIHEVPPLRLANFTYGPCPEDWKLQFETSEEEWVGAFWDTIEEQLEMSAPSIPGAWIEEE